jgi:hypothetical protein
MPKIKKAKPYTATVYLATYQEGCLFVNGILSLAEFVEVEGDEPLTNAMRGIFREMYQKFVSTLVRCQYPKSLKLKDYEAILIFRCSSPLSIIKQSFTGFINGVHQNLIV